MSYAGYIQQERKLRAAVHRKRRQRAKAERQERRTLLREIRPLLPLAVAVASTDESRYNARDTLYRRWSSRSLPGRLWRFGRTSRVRRWGIPRVVDGSAKGTIRRFVLTSNHKLVYPWDGMLYRRHRAAKIASAEELRHIKRGLKQMIGEYLSPPTSAS